MTRRPFTAEDVFNLKCSGDAGSPVPFTVKDSVNLTAHLDRQAGRGRAQVRRLWTLPELGRRHGRPISGYDVMDGVLAYRSSTPAAREDVFVLKDGVEKRLTSTNDEFMETLATGAAEKFSYTARDGQELDGWARPLSWCGIRRNFTACAGLCTVSTVSGECLHGSITMRQH